MPTPFDTLTIRAIQQRLAGIVSADALTARQYAAGDHWQSAAGWMGPRPASTEAGAAETLAEIQRAFISKNAVGEVMGRHISGVVGQPVSWRLTVGRPMLADEEPTPAEQDLIAEAEAALTTWWDEGGIASLIQSALDTLLCVSRAPLRLFVPSGLLIDGRLPPGDVPTQLSRIALDLPTPEAAIVLTDTATRQRAGVLLYEANKQTMAEVSAVDGELTALRILSGDSVQSEVALPLGGRLLLYDLTRKHALITPQVQALQRLLNLSLTMLGRNVVLGGFLERVLLNAQLPGTWAKDATGRDVFTPEPLRFGAGSVTALVGAEIRDERTGELSGYASPSVVYRDPVPVDSFERTQDIAYRAILSEVQQLHALGGDAALSGESRIQARADFLTSLALTAPTVERGVRWLLETALHLAAYFAGQPGRYLGLRAVATCKLSIGPVTADELAQIISLVDARLLSRESGMQRIGIDDTDAEAQRILSEREADATIGGQALTAFNSGA